MSSWNNWYNNFLENKKNKELQAFAAGLRGEKYIPPFEYPRFDSTTSWLDLLSISQTKETPNLALVEYHLKDGSISSNNPLILTCFDKARKNSSNSGSPRILNYLIFNHLKTLNIQDMVTFIRTIREIPESVFTDCNNCSYVNDLGWDICVNCRIPIENSYDN